MWSQLRMLPSLSVHHTDRKEQLHLALQSLDTIPQPPDGVLCVSLDRVNLRLSFTSETRSCRPRKRKRPAAGDGMPSTNPSQRAIPGQRIVMPQARTSNVPESTMDAETMVELFDTCFRGMLRSDLAQICPLIFMPSYASHFTQQYSLVSTLTSVISTDLYHRSSSTALKQNLEKLARVFLVELAVANPDVGIAEALQYSVRRLCFETIRSNLKQLDTCGQLARTVLNDSAHLDGGSEEAENEFLMLPHSSSGEDADSEFDALDDCSEDESEDESCFHPLTPPQSQSSPILLTSSSPMMHAASPQQQMEHQIKAQEFENDLLPFPSSPLLSLYQSESESDSSSKPEFKPILEPERRMSINSDKSSIMSIIDF